MHAETKKSIEITINEINVKHEPKQANHYNYNCVNCMEYMYNVAYKLIVHVHVQCSSWLSLLYTCTCSLRISQNLLITSNLHVSCKQPLHELATTSIDYLTSIIARVLVHTDKLITSY